MSVQELKQWSSLTRLQLQPKDAVAAAVAAAPLQMPKQLLAAAGWLQGGTG